LGKTLAFNAEGKRALNNFVEFGQIQKLRDFKQHIIDNNL